ncbi:MAG: DUF1684 domain-containing protein [Woeseiaceae bacterium]|nr:DUF1684 domain-containing protein [Gammaproteobacteria bacterium]NNK26233.1 DUF1684 domain-containing protein [Woeseiaceae bacterium]
MKKTILSTYLAMLSLATAACGQAGDGIDAAAHADEVLEWRAGRLERLLAPNGFLTQVGLHWVEAGSYSMGSAADSDILLPPVAAATVGELRVTAEGGVFMAAEGVEVTHDGMPASELVMPADTSGETVIAAHRSLAWSVIERGGKLAVRVRDYEHPWVASFGPLPYFDIDPALRVEAVLKRYDEPRKITVDTVIEGFQQFPVSPGVATFEIDGTTYELEPQSAGEQLFFVFGDATNRGDTYGAGRYLYTDMPGDDGRFIIDFNKSYSPPCAFNDFSTCPVASPRNRLPIRVEAGEKYDPALHYSATASR